MRKVLHIVFQVVHVDFVSQIEAFSGGTLSPVSFEQACKRCDGWEGEQIAHGQNRAELVAHFLQQSSGQQRMSECARCETTTREQELHLPA